MPVKGRILYVDDHQDTCEMVQTWLGFSGHEVVFALNTDGGFKRAREGGFDIIILDWLLKDGTGLDLCRKIRSFDPLTPILFCSGEGRDTELREGLIAGGQGFFVKPINMDDLLSIILACLEGKGEPQAQVSPSNPSWEGRENV